MPAPQLDEGTATGGAGSGVAVEEVWRSGTGRGLVAHLTEDGRLLVVTTIGVFESDGRSEPTEIVGFDTTFRPDTARFLDDGARVALAVDGSPVRVVDLRTGESTDLSVPVDAPFRSLLVARDDLVIDTMSGPVSPGSGAAVDATVAAGPSVAFPDGRLMVPRIDTATVDIVGPDGTTSIAVPTQSGERVRDVRVSPDGSIAAVSLENPDDIVQPGRIVVFGGSDLELLATVDTGVRFEAHEWTLTDRSVVVAANGEVVSFGADGVEQGRLTATTPVPPPVAVEASGPDVVLIRRDGAVVRWDGTGSSSIVLADGGTALASWSIATARNLMTTVDRYGAVAVRSLDDGSPIVESLTYSRGIPTSVAVGSDASIAVSTDRGDVWLLDPSGTVTATLPVADGARVDVVAFGPTGELATGLSDRRGDSAFDDTVAVWDVHLESPRFTMPGAAENVAGCSFFYGRVDFTADGSTMAVASHDFTTILVDVASGGIIENLPGSATIVDLAYMNDDEWLVVSHEDGTVDVWDTQEYSLVASYRPAAGRYDAIEPLPGGERMVVTDLNGSLSVVDVLSGDELSALEGLAAPMAALAVSPDGSLVAASTAGSGIGIWSTESDRQVATAAGHTGKITGLAITADGGQLISGSEDGTVRAWTLALG